MSVGSVGAVGASGGGAAAISAPAASVESAGAAESGAGAAAAESGAVQPVGTGRNPQEGAAGSSIINVNNQNTCNMSTQNFMQLHNMGSTQGVEGSQSGMDTEMLKKILEMMMVMAVLDALQQM